MATKTGPTRDELLVLILKERALLESAIGKLTTKQQTEGGVTDATWSTKDLMAHLAAWEQMFLSWHRAGLRGDEPETPAPGFTWSWESLAKLNERIYRSYRRKSLADVRRFFDESHQQVMQAFAQMSDDDLNRPRRFAWTGKGTLAGAVTANTWRHYRWARTLIEKWRKAQKREQRAT